MYYWKPFNRRRLTKFYDAFIQKGDLCFDIGAHIGNRTDAWLNLGAKIIALEPQPSCISYLEQRFGHSSKVIVLNKAVGAEAGTLPLKISNQHPTVTTLANHTWQDKVKAINQRIVWDEEINVAIVTLDQLIEEYGLPRFCKIDVEGFEAEVLAGLSKQIPIISFEFFSFTPIITEQCLEQLENIGNYQYNWSFGESQHLEMSKWGSKEMLNKSIQGYSKEQFSGDIYAKIN